MADRQRTATSTFGASRRESHDARAFYERFQPPALSDDEVVAAPEPVSDPARCGDARHMEALADASVALVVTSPPYFAGKAYEEELGRDGIPGSYLEYLAMLREVFAECVRVLEPGGRIAVNVANLGRRPYRSLSADVIGILQDDLGLLLRGEIIWQKAEGATGSCAWGSFRSATNPVLRDLTERIVVASKGRFDRGPSVARRQANGLPFRSTLLTEDFMALTLDVWSMPPEQARRVGHPAPFPVELPEQVIRLYTFENDLVLDPFMGSGSTLVAATRLGRRCVGYDLDPSYVTLAERRLAEAVAEIEGSVPPATSQAQHATSQVEQLSLLPAPGTAKNHSHDSSDSTDGHAQREAGATPSKAGGTRSDGLDRPGDAGDRPRDALDSRAKQMLQLGRSAGDLAEAALLDAGFVVTGRKRRVPRTGVTVAFEASDRQGKPWLFDVPGPYTSYRGGLVSTETVWKALGRAHALRGARPPRPPLVLLTTHLPPRQSDADAGLRAAGPDAFFDAVDLLDDQARTRLETYAGGRRDHPLPGFWTAAELSGARPTP